MLTTDQKGAIAETAIAHEATKLGIEVYRPVAEGGRFDMIFLLEDELVRVQCKWAPLLGDTILVRSYSSRRTRQGLRRRVYTSKEMTPELRTARPMSGATTFRSIRSAPERSCISALAPRETISGSGFIGPRTSSSRLH